MAESESDLFDLVDEELDEVSLTEEERICAGLSDNLPKYNLPKFKLSALLNFNLKNNSLSYLAEQPASTWNQMPENVYSALKVESFIVKPIYFLSATRLNTEPPHHRALGIDHLFTWMSEKDQKDRMKAQGCASWEEVASKLDNLLLPVFVGLKELNDKLQHINQASCKDDAMLLVERFKHQAEVQCSKNTTDIWRHICSRLRNFASDLGRTIANRQRPTETLSQEYICILFFIFCHSAKVHPSQREGAKLPLSLPVMKPSKKEMTVVTDVLFYCKDAAFLVGEVKRLSALIPDKDDDQEDGASGTGLHNDDSQAPTPATENTRKRSTSPECEEAPVKKLKDEKIQGRDKPPTSKEHKSYFRSLSDDEDVKVNIYLPQLIAEMLACLEYNHNHSAANVLYHKENVQVGFAVEGFKLRFVRLALRDTNETGKPSVRELGLNNIRSDLFLTKEFNLFNQRHLRMFYQLLYALLWAHQQGTHILPLYCFDPRHFKGTYHFSLPKTGPHRLKFLIESVRDLKTTLQRHGSDLVVRRGKPEVIVPAIIQLIGKDNISGLVFQKEVTDEEIKVEQNLQKNVGVPVHLIWGATLYHEDDLPFQPKRLPDVYTQFRKNVESQGQVRPLLDMPETLRPLPDGVLSEEIPTAAQLGGQDAPQDQRSAFPFLGGESSALARLKSYLWETDNVAKYKETRNGLIGSEYSTKFSSWLAHGCLSPRQIYWEIKKYENQRVANQSTYWVIFELLWRDYFRFVGLKYGNKLFFQGGIFGKEIPWKQDENLFRAWKEGRTGVPFVDANMRELAATGFMSNRGRQNVASFLTKDLKLDWRMGAEWFESMLVDHDVCSNYGNWLYSAGIGNDPREDRKFNMIKQGLDYDAEGEYIRLWIPELKGIPGGQIHTPWMVGKGILERAGISLGDTYPMPVVQAPEWAKHCGKQGGARAKSGKFPPPRQQKRGIDFYFKSSQH